VAEFTISWLREIRSECRDRLRDYVKTCEEQHRKGTNRAELDMEVPQGTMLINTAMLVALCIISQCCKYLHNIATPSAGEGQLPNYI
jgi:hypothetical protein